MTISTLPLSYCTNVHPGVSLSQVLDGLVKYTVAVKQRLDFPLAAGLWLAAPVVAELRRRPDGASQFVQQLTQLGLTCHTLNAFPYGNFHSERVKEAVYIPDWTSDARREYTADCARILAAMLPEGADGSISTVPLGFKLLATSATFVDDCISQLLRLTQELRALRQESGKLVRLAIEPEPLCVLETTAETLEFFARLRRRAAAASLEADVAEHLGVCFDICHQAVEFEDVAESIRRFTAAGVRLNKIHISCAIQLDDPRNEAARAALARYAEPRYLHQTFARSNDSRVFSVQDLSSSFATDPPDDFLDATMWRVHFHVPVDAEQLGPLSTTRPDLVRALRQLPELEYAPHLEVETYTWEVMPGRDPASLVDGLTREMQATWQLLDELR